jgi:hypothetical protein
MNDLAESTTTADEINRLHGELEALAVRSLDHAIRIGELLSEVKAQLPHGRWIPWLNSNLKFSERTARNYINVFEHRMVLKSARVADLTAAYKLLGDRARRSGAPEQENVEYHSKLPPMTREEAEQLHAKIVASFCKARDGAQKLVPEVLGYLKEGIVPPEYVERWRQAVQDLDRLLGPFDVSKDERKRFLE